MTNQDVTLWIQAIAVVVAVGASIVALEVSRRERKNSRDIAVKDRASALSQARLMFELDALAGLLENNNRGGSTDPAESKRLGAEALTLIGLIGRDRLPRQWDRRIAHDDAGLQAKLDAPESPDNPAYIKDAIETQLAVNQVVREIRAEVERG
ncbi:hypothetical protein GCM10025867_39770 [Frondihabitans sucicola]|uniref:Uncharacterized protein n=1 Tax=Frondihabitans sucicola TaxID=1268041 RepID=A0ABM8GTD0_9MICO|nr:hypothetical protein [Frondihabitans sucicola]BDZ51736.1 hypothetical protein GCM10025867_39770 [Frondihabitans sucicola]